MVLVPPAPWFILSQKAFQACLNQANCSVSRKGLHFARSLGKHNCGSPPDTEVAVE